MNIFLTGGCGYIGSHVCKQLSERHHEVTVFDNLSTGSKQALINGERLIQGDLANPAEIADALKSQRFEAIMHFAASISVNESVEDPLKYYTNNTRNTLNLIEQAQNLGIGIFIFSSTAAVYGEIERGIATEEDPTNPINPYGWSKLMSERLIRDSYANGKYAILRYFNVAGADPSGRIGQRNPNAQHLLKACMKAAIGSNDSVSIYGTDYNTSDGTGVRDYIHVHDLAKAHICALEYLSRGGKSDIFNIGYGNGQSVKEMISTVKEVTGIDFQVNRCPRRPGDPAMMISNAEKARLKLEWESDYDDLRAIVRHSWDWERKLNA